MKTKEDVALVLLKAEWTMEEIISVLLPFYTYSENYKSDSKIPLDCRFNKPYSESKMTTINIRPQEDYHGNASIVCDAAGLEALSKAIEIAKVTKSSIANVFNSDEEGYSIGITVLRDDAISAIKSKYFVERDDF